MTGSGVGGGRIGQGWPVSLLLAACGGAYATYAVAFGSSYTLRVLSIVGIYALLTLGYQFVFGHAGALALSQGTFMGVGAYVSGILGQRWGVPFDASMPLAIAAPLLLALLVAFPVLRLQTHYFALATLIIGQIALLVATEWESVTGGANGLGGVGGLSLLGFQVRNGWPTLLLVWSFVAAGALFAWIALKGQLGAAFAILRASEAAARSVAIDTDGLRLMAFLVSAAYAGAAGALYARVIGVISPEILSFPVMVTCLTIAVVGGRLRIAGAIAGAFVIIELPEWFRFLRDYYLLAYGCILLLVITTVPDGLVGAAERLVARALPRGTRVLPPPVALPGSVASADQVALLQVSGVTCRFGGVLALDRVSLVVRSGEVLGLIGPNGSGKTTLLNAVTGIYRSSAGRILFDGGEIGGVPAHAIARAGIARTFQTPALVEELSVLDNVALARGADLVGLFRSIAGGLREQALTRARAEAMTLLIDLGAAQSAALPCSALLYAARRRVEIARALALQPRLLLLDEPAAGLDETEQADLGVRLRRIAQQGVALLVVEHNMPFLVALADRLVCLEEGRVIAEGPPALVQANSRVIEAYLGRPAAITAGLPATTAAVL